MTHSNRMLLGVNIDHVATIRQARRTYEPDPVWAAVEAHIGGADGITVHLREDRRHIQDADVEKLRTLTQIKLNLEMAATDEMVEIACRLKPEMAMLVPEGRHEVTTEGGLDILAQETALKGAIARLSDAGIMSSVFYEYAPYTGCWYPSKKPGEYFFKGEELGELRDYYGNLLYTSIATENGVVLYQTASLNIIEDGPMIAYAAITETLT